MTKSMRKTRSIGRDIEGWDVSEVQIPGTKIGLWRSFLDTLVHGIGPRVVEPAVGLNQLLYFTAPYEEMRLKK